MLIYPMSCIALVYKSEEYAVLSYLLQKRSIMEVIYRAISLGDLLKRGN